MQSCNAINLCDGESKEEVGPAILEEESSVISPTTSEMVDDSNFQNLWEDECMRYLERAPEFRARLHYEVRVILISPAFHVAGRTVTAFARLYEKKFGRTIDSVGFSTAARLCRSMPHVVQRALLIDEGKLRLVDTPKNHRIVAGIRSGLRRFVYGIIKRHQGFDMDIIETLLYRVIGQPLTEVLIDHGYQTPTIECLLRDAPDIVYLDERPDSTRVYLCSGAEDPALTDGLLIQGPSLEEYFEGISKDKRKFNESGSICYSKLLEEGKLEAFGHDIGKEVIKSLEGPRSGPSGMAPEELSDLRVLCAAESSSPYTDASVYTVEDVSPHVRLRFRLLLALHNDGHGVKVEELSSVYEKMFSTPLDLSALGFDSIEELIDTWKDVILVKNSNAGWVFPINTLENNRVLNTITSGLRSAIFAILLARYPEGLEPLELVECLEETLSGKLWEILKSNGYIFKDINKAQEALSKGPSDFQLAECSELRLLLKDLEDFVRLGCREDGALVVKLRDGEFPLLDLLDCEVSEEPTSPKDEQSSGSTNIDAITAKLRAGREDLLLDQAAEASYSAIMDIQLPTSMNTKDLTIQDDILYGNLKNEGLTPLITRSIKKIDLPLSSTSSLSISNVQVDTPKQVCSPTPRLIHETRMILGSPEHMENGLTVEEFCTIYKERTGQRLHLGEYKSMESLLQAMPDIVSFELNSTSDEQMVTLVQSRRNMRILSIAKAGLRQVLFWILLKNPRGIWKELLEGWYLDFAGWPLSSALASHGYDKPRSAPLEPVIEFLQDMGDILTMDEKNPNLYVWAGLYEDPIIADASLLGVPIESIQYNPTNEENENPKWQTSIIVKAATQSKNKELQKPCIMKTTLPIGDNLGVEAH
ncbi:hypothetical protein KC19_12G170400 [Ceratodon purpureus]|uniref:HTH OST-type domain-containing protein n=1 Tax=Ceratodon purpureus TaxID=3225 RepID=A0A8T0G9P5_CERPU|nr:hypothetical protein KC19_12G170400 [Ceratodon purpureus]